MSIRTTLSDRFSLLTMLLNLPFSLL
jgi:hypothetical protein